MGFEIIIDTWEAEGRIERVMEKLKVVPVPAELTRWQTEDMNRRYPNTEVINATTALTVIYPRSRRQAVWLKRQRPKARRTKPLLRGRATRLFPASTRPILRPVLFERLCERMSAMLAREAGW